MEPGRYDNLPISEYHAGPGISRSALKVLEDGTPRDLQWYLANGVKETDAMKLGSAVDMMFFEPDQAKELIVVRPTFSRKKADQEAKAEWEDAHAGHLLLSETQTEQANAMVTAIRKAESVRALLKDIEAQPSYYFMRDGVLLKCRPDAVANGRSVDMKTCADMAERKRWTAIVDFGYDAQAAMCREGVLAAGEEWTAHILLWCGKSAPHDVHLQLIEPGDIILDLGEKRYEKWLAVYAEALRTGRWPGRSHLIEKMKTPHWVARKLEDEIDLENKRAQRAGDAA